MKIVPTSAQNRIKADIFEIVTLLTMPLFWFFISYIKYIYIYICNKKYIYNINIDVHIV